MKENINTLLKARGQTRRDLARWCRRSDAWIAKIMAEDGREFPMKYFDRIADFFGIATYQLLQPGISPLTERRKGVNRRSGRDRRLSHALPLSQRPGDVDLMDIIRALSRDGREHAIKQIGDILSDEIQRLRTRPSPDAERDRRDENSGSTPPPARARKRSG